MLAPMRPSPIIAICIPALSGGSTPRRSVAASTARTRAYNLDTVKRFKDLTERELLALAISLEEEDERVYADFAEGFREHYPATAQVFAAMQVEESEHRRALTELFRERFGDHVP